MAAQIGGSLNEPQQEYVGDIRQAGDLLLSIINGVLELSKIELGKLDLKPQPTDIANLIHKTARLISSQAIASGVAVRVEVTPGLPEVFVDPHSLQQILLNLLSNACKFTPVGGRVLIRGRRGQGRWGLEIRVADNGIGMKPGDLAKAMEMFSQLDRGFNRRFGGTGIGLPLTKRLVELQGGKLLIASRPSKGTVVTVRLPAERLIWAETV